MELSTTRRAHATSNVDQHATQQKALLAISDLYDLTDLRAAASAGYNILLSAHIDS
jgi:hypothetical protein